MSLSTDLISQFVKATNDTEPKKDGATVYGTIVYDGKPYVRIDGSELLTPITTTTDVKDGERVTVLVKDHTAVVTGNVSSPSARTDDVKDLTTQRLKVNTLVADKVSTEALEAQIGRIDTLVSDNVTIRKNLDAVNADISNLEADNVTINEKLTADKADIEKLKTDKIDATVADLKYATVERLEATEGEFHTLESTYAQFESTTTGKLNAFEANILNLDSKYANIDFSNIGEAAITKIFSESGIIEDLVVSEGKITGELVGVTIKGDLIEGNTIMADKLVVRGEDGVYYKLNIEGGATTSEEVTDEDLQNGLHGSVIIAQSITAEKVAVTDLVAFGATIGGFRITDKAIFSGVKESVENGTAGVYMDSDGQFAVGDGENYIKFAEDENGLRKLEISAGSITEEIKEATAGLEETTQTIKKHFSFDNNGLTISAGESTMSLRIDNDLIIFEKNGVQFGYWDGVDFHTGNIMIEVTDRAQFGNFAYIPRSDGSLSFLKVDHKAGFYAVLRGGIMSFYGAYPTLDGNTLVISDVPGELSGTTLILNGGQ